MTDPPKSRVKFPVKYTLALTEVQDQRAQAISEQFKTSKLEAIRRSIDFLYFSLFSQSSTDTTEEANK